MLTRCTQAAGYPVQLLRPVIKMFTDVKNQIPQSFKYLKNEVEANINFPAPAKHL